MHYYYGRGNFVKEKMPGFGECGTMKQIRHIKRENTYDFI